MMLFDNYILKNDILREFSGYEIDVSEDNGCLEFVFGNNEGKDLVLRIDEDMTLGFDRWHEKYRKTDEEYERMLWDTRDILNNKAYAVSVMIGEHLFLSFLTRQKMNSADAFIDDDPREYAELLKTGGIIECVYRRESLNRQYSIEKGITE